MPFVNRLFHTSVPNSRFQCHPAQERLSKYLSFKKHFMVLITFAPFIIYRTIQKSSCFELHVKNCVYFCTNIFLRYLHYCSIHTIRFLKILLFLKLVQFYYFDRPNGNYVFDQFYCPKAKNFVLFSTCHFSNAQQHMSAQISGRIFDSVLVNEL